jgi:hydrogenase maturation protease
VGISDLLATLAFMGKGPRSVVLFGVEPERLSLDLELSERVSARVPELCARVVAELDRIGVVGAKPRAETARAGFDLQSLRAAGA